MDAEKNAEGRQAIFNPRNLRLVAQLDFCGACHRTLYDVHKASISGVENVRFQPYRLENSRCWGDGHARLTCATCHDPHKPLNHDPGAYDKKCLACHASSRSQKRSQDRPGKACPAAAKNCVTCHMPQVQLPSMHSLFVDHRSRVTRSKSAYPD